MCYRNFASVDFCCKKKKKSALIQYLLLICLGGASVIKAKVDVQAPRLHYVHPICFEAGKPMEIVACGSNLLQPKLRYGSLLESFRSQYRFFLFSVFTSTFICYFFGFQLLFSF